MIDVKIKEAIIQAVNEEEQQPELANKIIAWMESVSAGDEEIHTGDNVIQRCELCFESTNIDKEQEK